MFGNADAKPPTTAAAGVPAGSVGPDGDQAEFQAPPERSQNDDADANAQTMTAWLADLPSQCWDLGE
ncbi:hypothetical protein E3T26_08395 [Cryobacterium sp. TMT1-21]|uniref:Uncharacterized protein n=1 Tax=Cryobacterium shii TaxID=1259235 RepID=A0AAQ2HEZ0_9MICO|nr:MULTISPECIES: hypothetical protein [Cryobacterium]TFC44673.1 hypothetical protein E3O49_11390 [Cryobacterium shii]TFC85664.1 hypothetical protein E3T24_07880 [Cryobacterium sp. TmT2-59]TFD14597.1 hypothetical protein E3T26_08395 [Cryobacterium sp. TMT1-21]TFD17215.1 hypothetical protein E3T32_14135 [Cryobacterium sp. TMT2-23]TFD17796.1 hypothetical protein E3T42_07085 [Cryobacterium sp. TMT4-10]